MAEPTLSFQDQQELVKILTRYGRVDVNQRRTNFLYMMGLHDEDPDLVAGIPVDGDTATFCQTLVKTLNGHGRLPSGEIAILLLIRYMQDQVRGHPNLVQNLKIMEAKLQGQGQSPIRVVGAQLQLVGLFANPKDLPTLKVEHEERILRNILQRHPFFNVTTVTRTRAKDFMETLDAKRPAIFHYSGHANVIGIMVESEDGSKAVPIPWLALAKELDLSPNLQCVVLNGCDSVQNVFIEGFKRKNPYIIAMTEPVSDKRATAFAQRFYEALAAGDSYEIAFEKACNVHRIEGYYYEAAIPKMIAPR